MSTIIEFQSFPKMGRLSRGCVITEKIDGTNAQVCIGENNEFLVGSRNRWITPQDDNYGFAAWAHENRDELLKLGPGRHFGEWLGRGIQRGNGTTERRFSLFNSARWSDDAARPLCCCVVPVLYRGEFDTGVVLKTLSALEEEGSAASLGFMKPEGVIVYHVGTGISFKKTIEGDEKPKGTQCN